MDWPLDFQGELLARLTMEQRVHADPSLIAMAKLAYAADPVLFVSDCVYVFEPRNANRGEPVRIPAVPFPRQADFIRWMHERFVTRTSAPVEKSRDSGATWMASAFAVWMWLFHPGSTFGFGSRKEDLVDRAGDLNSIFEKIRSIIRHLPHYLLPGGFSPKVHFNHMRIVNPENDAVIVGEAGDNIGRGGRSSVYVIDEAAFIERPHMIEASLTANTDCRIDISSQKVGTLFYEWTKTNPLTFVFDIRDAPWHTDEWIAAKDAELSSKGLGYIFAAEYLRDATAGIDGQLIKGAWVEAAVDACRKLGIAPTGERLAALDVADGGRDRNALAMLLGVEVQDVRTRPDILADEAGRWAYGEATAAGCHSLRYDSIGVGAGAAAALRDKKDVVIRGWSAAGAVVNPKAKYLGNRTNEQMFANAKAQAWWCVRDRFIKTFRAVKEGKPCDPDEIISLNPAITELRELKSELCQVTYKHNEAGKVVVNKAPDGHPSPNRADCVVIGCAPLAVQAPPSVTTL